MNGRVPCFKKKNIYDGNAPKRVCKEVIASTSNNSSWTKNSVDETSIEDDFDFNKEDLQNCFLFESQFLDNDKRNADESPEANSQAQNEKTFNKSRSFAPSKSTYGNRHTNFPDFSDLISKNLSSQTKSSNCIQFKNDKGKTFINGNSTNSNAMNSFKQKISKLEDELLVKQGEVSNLRLEIKRKENTLEAERIERCIAIDEAECKGKQKGEKALADINVKMKKVKQELERVQSDVIFKNREIEELTAKQKQMKFQGHLKNSQVHSVTKDHRISSSQKKNNFADKFDFELPRPKLKNAAVQTSSSEIDRKKRIFLKLKCRSKQFIIPQEYLSVNKLSLQLNSSKLEELDEVIQNSTTFACQNLETLRIQCSDGSSPWSNAGISANTWYKKNCLMHLKFLYRLKSFNAVDTQNASLTEILKQALPISSHNRIVNAENQTEVIEALCNVITNTSVIPETILCDILTITKSILSSPQNKEMLISILSLMVTFASCKGIKNRICTNDGSCILVQFFDRLEDINDWGYSLSVVCVDLLQFISELLRDPPHWLTNVECRCPTVLFNSVALYLHSQTKTLTEKSELSAILMSYVRVIYKWAMSNQAWWEVNESYPACRVLLNTLWELASGPLNQIDQHTTTLLKQLL